MDINKAFLVETNKDGAAIIYNVGKKFFEKAGRPSGIMKCFNPSDKKEKNKYVAGLIKDGWCPLSKEDIDKTHVNSSGVITAYPFKYRKGYISIEKIEVLARKMGYKWECTDHDTNPYSVIKDYTNFTEILSQDTKHNIASLTRTINTFANRLDNIGAIMQIENFFTEMHYIPDPRRFNKSTKELWTYYRSHIKDCCRLVWDDIYGKADESFDIGALIDKLKVMQSLQQSVSESAYEEWLMQRGCAKL